MRPLVGKLNKIGISLIIVALLSFIGGDVSYPDAEEAQKRLENGTDTLLPGYRIRDKQKSEEILKQAGPERQQFIEKEIQHMQDKLTEKLSEDAKDKVKPDLKRKKSPGEAVSGQQKMPGIVYLNTDGYGIDYNVEVGSGEAQFYIDENSDPCDETYEGKTLIAEYFNGEIHVYAGSFADGAGFDSIQSAINYAADYHGGGYVLVRGGTYSVDTAIKLAEGIKLYGGYRTDGTRDIANTPTIIEGRSDLANDQDYSGIFQAGSWYYKSIWSPEIAPGDDEAWIRPTEINGFTIRKHRNARGININNSSSFTIANIEMIDYDDTQGANDLHKDGIYIVGNSNVLVANAIIHNVGYGSSIFAWGSTVEIFYTDIRGGKYGITGINNSHIVVGDTEVSDLKWDYEERKICVGGGTDVSYVEPPPLTTSVGPSLTLPSDDIFRDFILFSPYDFTSDFFISLDDERFPDPLSGKTIASIFSGLFVNMDTFLGEDKDEINEALVAELVEDLLDTAALSVPITGIDTRAQEIEIALLLVKIMKNPTEDEKLMLDAIAALMEEAKNIEEETGSDELKQASEDLVQVAATVLLAQALPGLLKEGDVSSMKAIFGELNDEKSHILLEYHNAAKAYYTSIVKELASNMVVLQIKDILAEDMTEEKLAKLSFKQIDEIIDKIQKLKERTHTEEYILNKEAEYREKYLVPAMEKLEESMKLLLGAFTQRLFAVLDDVGLVVKEE